METGPSAQLVHAAQFLPLSQSNLLSNDKELLRSRLRGVAGDLMGLMLFIWGNTTAPFTESVSAQPSGTPGATFFCKTNYLNT